MERNEAGSVKKRVRQSPPVYRQSNPLPRSPAGLLACWPARPPAFPSLSNDSRLKSSGQGQIACAAYDPRRDPE